MSRGAHGAIRSPRSAVFGAWTPTGAAFRIWHVSGTTPKLGGYPGHIFAGQTLFRGGGRYWDRTTDLFRVGVNRAASGASRLPRRSVSVQVRGGFRLSTIAVFWRRDRFACAQDVPMRRPELVPPGRLRRPLRPSAGGLVAARRAVVATLEARRSWDLQRGSPPVRMLGPQGCLVAIWPSSCSPAAGRLK